MRFAWISCILVCIWFDLGGPGASLGGLKHFGRISKHLENFPQIFNHPQAFCGISKRFQGSCHQFSILRRTLAHFPSILHQFSIIPKQSVAFPSISRHFEAFPINTRHCQAFSINFQSYWHFQACPRFLPSFPSIFH